MIRRLLPFVTTALLSTVITVLYLNWVTPPPLSIAVVDKHELTTRFTTTLDDSLSPNERAKALKHFTHVLVSTINEFEQETGTLVLNKDALFIPNKNDMTEQVEAHINTKINKE